MFPMICKWLPREESARSVDQSQYMHKTHNSSATDYEYWFNENTEETCASYQDKEALIGSLIAKNQWLTSYTKTQRTFSVEENW